MKNIVVLCICLLSIPLAAQSRYSDKKFGISLRSPSSYKLKEGELGEDDTLGYLGPIPMEFGAPGGFRVVTVEIPADTYAGTDFNTAFVTVSVNQYLTREECQISPDDVSGSRKPMLKRISGLEFRGYEQGDAGLGHQFGGIYYHAFAKGSCYELGEGMATSGYGAVDGMKKVDGKGVFAILDRILASVRIHAPKAGVSAQPSIQSFVLSPLIELSPTSTYRISWDVKGAAADQVWLSGTCPHDVSIRRITGSAPEGPEFTNEALVPAAVATGSLDLELRNMTGGELEETIRIFAAGQPSVSRSVTIDLSPLPVVISVLGNGKYIFPFDSGAVQIVVGHHVELVGVAFLPHQTLWIGSTSLPIESADRGSISFTMPESLAAGQYPMFVTNERGRSNVVPVQVLR